MKLFRLFSNEVSGIPAFFIQANDKNQAERIRQHLVPFLRDDIQPLAVGESVVIPTLSHALVSLAPWRGNDNSGTQSFRMDVNGLQLVTAVSDNQTQDVADFCCNFNVGLNIPECASQQSESVRQLVKLKQVDGIHFYSVWFTPVEGENEYQLFIEARVTEMPTLAASLFSRVFRHPSDYRVDEQALCHMSLPVINIMRYKTDADDYVYELVFVFKGISLTCPVGAYNFRNVLMLCENFSVQPAFNFDTNSVPFIRRELMILKEVTVYTRCGSPDDVRSFADDKEKQLIDRLMTQVQLAAELTPARHGRQFNGILVDASPSGSTTGFIFYSEPDFPQGQFVSTGEVVAWGSTFNGISYIETIDGYRFIITFYHENWMHSLREFIRVNESYFSLYRWS